MSHLFKGLSPHETVSCVEMEAIPGLLSADLTDLNSVPSKEGLINSHFIINEWMAFFSFSGEITNKASLEAAVHMLVIWLKPR